MKENNLQLVQNEITEALNTVETMEDNLTKECLTKESLKEKFVFLSNKLRELENVLKQEGIL